MVPQRRQRKLGPRLACDGAHHVVARLVHGYGIESFGDSAASGCPERQPLLPENLAVRPDRGHLGLRLVQRATPVEQVEHSAGLLAQVVHRRLFRRRQAHLHRRRRLVRAGIAQGHLDVIDPQLAGLGDETDARTVAVLVADGQAAGQGDPLPFRPHRVELLELGLRRHSLHRAPLGAALDVHHHLNVRLVGPQPGRQRHRLLALQMEPRSDQPHRAPPLLRLLRPIHHERVLPGARNLVCHAGLGRLGRPPEGLPGTGADLEGAIRQPVRRLKISRRVLSGEGEELMAAQRAVEEVQFVDRRTGGVGSAGLAAHVEAPRQAGQLGHLRGGREGHAVDVERPPARAPGYRQVLPLLLPHAGITHRPGDALLPPGAHLGVENRMRRIDQAQGRSRLDFPRQVEEASVLRPTFLGNALDPQRDGALAGVDVPRDWEGDGTALRDEQSLPAPSLNELGLPLHLRHRAVGTGVHAHALIEGPVERRRRQISSAYRLGRQEQQRPHRSHWTRRPPPRVGLGGRAGRPRLPPRLEHSRSRR